MNNKTKLFSIMSALLLAGNSANAVSWDIGENTKFTLDSDITVTNNIPVNDEDHGYYPTNIHNSMFVGLDIDVKVSQKLTEAFSADLVYKIDIGDTTKDSYTNVVSAAHRRRLMEDQFYVSLNYKLNDKTTMDLQAGRTEAIVTSYGSDYTDLSHDLGGGVNVFNPWSMPNDLVGDINASTNKYESVLSHIKSYLLYTTKDELIEDYQAATGLNDPDSAIRFDLNIGGFHLSALTQLAYNNEVDSVEDYISDDSLGMGDSYTSFHREAFANSSFGVSYFDSADRFAVSAYYSMSTINNFDEDQKDYTADEINNIREIENSFNTMGIVISTGDASAKDKHFYAAAGTYYSVVDVTVKQASDFEVQQMGIELTGKYWLNTDHQGLSVMTQYNYSSVKYTIDDVSAVANYPIADTEEDEFSGAVRNNVIFGLDYAINSLVMYVEYKQSLLDEKDVNKYNGLVVGINYRI